MPWTLQNTKAVTFYILVLTLVYFLVFGVGGFGSFIGVGQGTSMEPTLSEGDLIFVTPIEVAQPVEEGDIIVFESQHNQGPSIIIHRVLRVTENGYITAGDNNRLIDQLNDTPPLSKDNIHGKIPVIHGHLLAIPYLGYIILYLREINLILEAARAIATISLLFMWAYLLFIVYDEHIQNRPRNQT